MRSQTDPTAATVNTGPGTTVESRDGALDGLVAAVGDASGGALLERVARFLASELDAPIAVVVERSGAREWSTRAAWVDGQPRGTWQWPVTSDPFGEIAASRRPFVRRDARGSYPDGSWLADLRVAGFAGAPMLDGGGGVGGVVAVMARVPLSDAPPASNLLQAAAWRAGLELERWRNGRTLAYSERAHDALMSAMPDPIVRVGADGVVREVRWGSWPRDAPADAFVGRSIRELVDSDGAEAIEYRLALALESGAPQMVEVDVLHDGDTRRLELRVARLDGDEAVFVVRDVTRRRRFENGMQRSQRMVSLGALAAGVAHKFNNHLMGIMGYADVVATRLPRDSKARPLLDKIRVQARQAGELANRLLAYSGEPRIAAEPLDLNRLVRETTSLIEATLGSGTALTLRPCEELEPIRGDSAQLRQAVLNLLTNAVEASAEGGVIEVTTGRTDADREPLGSTVIAPELAPGRYAFVEVRDGGPGLEPGIRDRIFEPFFTTKFIGRGLGLTAVLGIMRGHGGEICVDSTPGSGSSFRLLLPLGG